MNKFVLTVDAVRPTTHKIPMDDGTHAYLRQQKEQIEQFLHGLGFNKVSVGLSLVER